MTQGSPTGAQGSPNGDLGGSWEYKIQEILTIAKKDENEWHPGGGDPLQAASNGASRGQLRAVYYLFYLVFRFLILRN